MTHLQYGESFNGHTIDVAVSQTIEIHLQENPTTGFRWQLTANDAAACALISDAFKEPPGPPGRGGEHSWMFEAVRPGECDIELRYRRRWEHSVEAERTFRIHVRIERPQPGAKPSP